MEVCDFGKSAKCGINGADIIVSKYNFKCPCLNCADCKNENNKCKWKYVLQTNPCTDDDLQAVVCQNCIAITRMQTQQQR